MNLLSIYMNRFEAITGKDLSPFRGWIPELSVFHFLPQTILFVEEIDPTSSFLPLICSKLDRDRSVSLSPLTSGYF